VPTTPAAPVITSAVHAHAPVCACQQGYPATVPGRRAAPTLGVAAGAVAAVVTVGVPVAAVSVAVVALVLRSLLAPPRRR
jgi:hypothetical protein